MKGFVLVRDYNISTLHFMNLDNIDVNRWHQLLLMGTLFMLIRY